MCSHEEYDIPGTPIVNAIKQNLEKEFAITTWMDNVVFPIADTRSSVDRFLQSLFSFDGVILLLTGDDIRRTKEGKHEQIVRDNLVFELGACMAHFGPSRTFVMMPDDGPTGDTILPSYFRDYKPLRWNKDISNPIGSTSVACGHVATRFFRARYKYCDIGLPAMMSAHSYTDAFLAKIIGHVDGPEHSTCSCALHTSIKQHGGKYSIGVVLDEDVLGHREGPRYASNVLCTKNRFTKVSLKSLNSREINTMFKVINGEVWIIDVPTIMHGFRQSIGEMDKFWGTGGVEGFSEMMIQSELDKFTDEIVRECKAVHIVGDIKDLGLNL